MRPRALLAAICALALAVAPAAGESGVSQGAFRIGADAFWSQGLLGDGQTVAVLDQGFGGLDDSIAAGLLPPREQMTLASFDAAYGLDGRDVFGDPTDHGTRIAEVVHSIAPDAHLVLVNYHTVAEFVQATDWIVGQGIPIVNHSNSLLDPPYDGSGPAAQAVDRAAAAGVLWVNSAGNYARRHWAGTFTDQDGDGFEDFAGQDALPFATNTGDTLQFVLSWPAALGARYALLIERPTPDGYVEAARGEPAGGEAVTPAVSVDVGGTWRVAVVQEAGPPAPLDLYSRTVGFGSLAVPAGSIATPGDAAGALTVGATEWTTDQLAGYSSQGPTADGLTKPDLVAPTDVTVNPAYPDTAGTSAAAPHVAAAAALLRQQRQLQGLPVDAGTLRTLLLAQALPLGAEPADAVGAGRLRLDVTPPTVVVRVGRAGPAPTISVPRGSRPLLSVQAGDDGTVADVRILEGTRVLASRPGPRLYWRPPPLAAGRHPLIVEAQDLAGNRARTRLMLVAQPASASP